MCANHSDSRPQDRPQSGIQSGLSGLVRLRGMLHIGQCLLGLDSGKKRWGVAVSDDALRVALPLVQYTRRSFRLDLDFLAEIIAERRIGGIIIGLPLHMSGETGPRAQAAWQLAHDLESGGLGLSTALWDERLSSVAVDRVMIREADLSRKKRARSIDRLAASYILQGALDALSQAAEDS